MRNASFLLICCLIASGFAKPAVFLGYQDSLGQYSFGYSAPGSARSEVRTSNGATKGTYSYVDGTGVIQTAQYVADGENGFRVIATNLPQAPLPVQDTPEVMAARTAHLHALELETKRQEEAQSHAEVNSENAKASQSDVNLSRTQLQSEASLAGSTPKENEKSAMNAELEKKKSESLPTIHPPKSDGDKGSEKIPQGVFEKSSGSATQEIHVKEADVPATPSISSTRLLVPETPGRQQEVPVFRISHGSHEIEPSAIPVSSITQGTPGMITPAGTALKKSAAISDESATALKGKEQLQRAGNVQATNVGTTLIAPISLIPLSTSHSSFVSYVSPASLRLVTYNIL